MKLHYDCSKCPAYCCSYERIIVSQRDLKRLVAYSSVSHLGIVVLGLCAMNINGVQVHQANAHLIAAEGAGLALFVIDAPHLYARAGNPYVDRSGRDWPDNAQRFAALSFVAAELGSGVLKRYKPNIVHAHDWQAGLAPAYLHYAGGQRPATVLTVAVGVMVLMLVKIIPTFEAMFADFATLTVKAARERCAASQTSRTGLAVSGA